MSAPTRCTIAARVEQGTRFFPRSAAALNVPPGRGPRRWGSPPPWNPARRRHPLPRFRFPASLDPARSPLACQESGEHIAAASNRSVAASALSLLPPRGGELNKSGQPAGPLSPAAPRTTHMWSLKLYGKEAWKEVIGSPWRHSGQFGRATLGAQLAAIFGEKKKKKKTSFAPREPSENAKKGLWVQDQWKERFTQAENRIEGNHPHPAFN
ncbi:hypothetical protein HPB48_002946 [Haemaphysalis longicornis]|uniref:Uncharacterized protein n=1 Tax=Haemaphysalis longicornis TaxID=44386 RepID=A0A9J6FGB9_HAELO|nr:hypothetical protein HPB48_002946 [Haemaphysalis longicornis]